MRNIESDEWMYFGETIAMPEFPQAPLLTFPLSSLSVLLLGFYAIYQRYILSIFTYPLMMCLLKNTAWNHMLIGNGEF